MTDLADTYIRLHASLKKAENDMEQAIHAYSLSVELYGNAQMAYRKRCEAETVQARREGEPVTLVSTLVKGRCAAEEMEVVKAEGDMKKCKHLIDLFEHKINDYKFTGRKMDSFIDKAGHE